jgi:hypothetical protein
LISKFYSTVQIKLDVRVVEGEEGLLYVMGEGTDRKVVGVDTYVKEVNWTM